MTVHLKRYLRADWCHWKEKPGFRPFWVGEVLRRVSEKIVMAVMKENVIQASSSNQMCSGQDKGCSVAIHSMRQLFDDEGTEAVLLVDADNAFNRIKRKALLRNINMLYPIFGRYLNNCYRIRFRLFVIGGFVERRNDSKGPYRDGNLSDWNHTPCQHHTGVNHSNEYGSIRSQYHSSHITEVMAHR